LPRKASAQPKQLILYLPLGLIKKNTLRYKIIIVGLLILSLNSCNEESLENKIKGIWVFDNMINKKYLTDTTDFFKQHSPSIYDFQDNGKLIVKIYGNRDITFNWSLKTDSLLKLDSLKFRLFKIGQDSAVLIDYNSVDTFWLTLKRPVKADINLNKSKIEELLLSNKWAIENPENQEWLDQFDYFKNGAMIYKYVPFDKNLSKDTTEHFQLETWGVAKYDEYFFLYSYTKWMLGVGNIDRINQIIAIDETSYTLTDSYSKNNKAKYVVVPQINERTSKENRIKGKWKSKNMKDKTYGKRLPLALIDEGAIEFFEGDLFLTINDGKLSFQINNLNPMVYNWELSKDAKTLMLDFKVNESEIQGVKYNYVELVELTDNKLKIRMFDNNYYTGKDMPYSYLLNLMQDFERIE